MGIFSSSKPKKLSSADIRRIEEESRMEVARLIALEREQMRLAKEQEKQRQDIVRHEEWLKKHDAEIEKLQFRLDKAEEEITHYSYMLEMLVAKNKEMSFELGGINRALLAVRDTLNPTEIAHNEGTEQFSGTAGALEYMERYSASVDSKDKKKASAEIEKMKKRKAALEDKILMQNNKIFSVRQKIKKAEFDRDETRRKMEVA